MRFMSALLLLSSALSAQGVWYVDASACPGPGDGTPQSPFCTIQQGVDAAAVGETVLVRPGTYDRFGFLSKDVLVRSDVDGDECTIDPDPAVTIVDGLGVGPIVDFVPGSDAALLEGFTLTNGATDIGGGIRIIFAAPTIRGNVILNCSATSHGGGIYSASSEPVIEGNRIEGCSTSNHGGAIYVEFGDAGVPIRDNVLQDNQAKRGGGIYMHANGGTIERNEITENSASDGGAGIWLEGQPASLLLKDNLIAGNTETKYGGGGLFVNGGSHPTVENNMFLYNSTSGTFGYGGACLVNSGGSDFSIFRHNTVVGNTANIGGAFLLSSSSKVKFQNGILWDNSSPSGANGHLQGPCELTVAHSAVQGGEASFVTTGNPSGVVTYGLGNVESDPLFASPAGLDGILSTWEDNDYHLTVLSPCIDKADTPLSSPFDFEGDPRPIDGDDVLGAESDMGADEWFCHLYHVGTATPGGTITLNLTGPPGSFGFVYLSLSQQNPPIPLPPWGNLLIAFPIIQVWALPAIDATGAAAAQVVLPTTATVGLTLYLQGFVGDKFTNLDVVVIE